MWGIAIGNHLTGDQRLLSAKGILSTQIPLFPPAFQAALQALQNCPERELVTAPCPAVARAEQELTLVAVAVEAMNSSAFSQFIIPPAPPRMPERAGFSWMSGGRLQGGCFFQFLPSQHCVTLLLTHIPQWSTGTSRNFHLPVFLLCPEPSAESCSHLAAEYNNLSLSTSPTNCVVC